MKKTIIFTLITLIALMATVPAFGNFELTQRLERVREVRSKITANYMDLIGYIVDNGGEKIELGYSCYLCLDMNFELGANASYGFEGLKVEFSGRWVSWGTWENGILRDGYILNNQKGLWKVEDGVRTYI